MKRIEALNIVKKYIKNKRLFNHMLAVEAAMRFYAIKNGQDEDLWGITGLLHDFDWEIHPSIEMHPQKGAEILREYYVPEVIIHAILSHSNHTGIERETLMEKALYACDEITGLITAVALVRPSKSIKDVKVSSVKKKWKNKSFAVGANREEIARAANEFDIDLWEHTENIIQAMCQIAEEIGLDGKNIE